LAKAAGIISDFPDSDYLRTHFYRVEGKYKKLIDRAKNKFFDILISDIESGKVPNWKQFKKLKKCGAMVDKFDSFDMGNFQTPFTKLYYNTYATIKTVKENEFLREANFINDRHSTTDAQSALNKQISLVKLLMLLKLLKIAKVPPMT
jgi:hypothetical protein